VALGLADGTDEQYNIYAVLFCCFFIPCWCAIPLGILSWINACCCSNNVVGGARSVPL
jgi:hypothetical protein